MSDNMINEMDSVFALATTGFDVFYAEANEKSSGDSSKAASSGNYSTAASSGDFSACSALGYRAAVKGDIGNLLMASEYVDNKPVGGLAALVDGNTLKPQCWYIVEGGKWVEVDFTDRVFSYVLKTTNGVKKVRTDGDVTVKEGAGYWVNISAGGAKSRIAGMAPESFPDSPESPNIQASIPAAVLGKVIKQGSYASSTEHSRFSMNGALMELSDNVLRVVSTDGHRLALAESKLDGDNGDFRALVPQRALAECAKSAGMAGIGTAVNVAIDGDRAYFYIGNVRLFCRLLSGNFPDYKRAIPALPNSLTVDRGKLYSLISRVMDFADATTKAVKSNISEGRITFSSALSNVGDCEEGIDVETTGPDTSTGMNGLYIMEALKNVDTERAQIHWKDDKKAIKINAVADNVSAFSVIMPMRVN